MQADERYKDFTFATTGHSLGGGMGQSFALRNNLDAYVYNSLPIARDTIKGNYFQDVGGFDAALARYQNSGRTVHDIRTPNDIATATYDTVMRNQYLSDSVPPGAQQLPGAAIPDVLKIALLTSKVGAVPALAMMANDHTMGAMFNAAYGLGVNEQTGAFRIPEGHADFAAIPGKVRQQFAELSTSPISKVFHAERGETHDGATSAYDRFELTREDGSKQRLSIHAASGDIELDHRHPDGKRTLVNWNPKKEGPLRVLEFDARGEKLEGKLGAAQGPELQATREALVAQPAAAKAKAISPEIQAQLAQVQSHISPALTSKGFSPQQIDQISAATLAHLARNESKGGPERFLVAKDGSSIAVDHGQALLSEMPTAPALKKDAAMHLSEAGQERSHSHRNHANLAHNPQTPVPAMEPMQR
jgi:hypothetical protein